MKRWIGVALIALGVLAVAVGAIALPGMGLSAMMFLITPGLVALLAGCALIYASVGARPGPGA